MVFCSLTQIICVLFNISIFSPNNTLNYLKIMEDVKPKLGINAPIAGEVKVQSGFHGGFLTQSLSKVTNGLWLYSLAIFS